MIDAVINRLKKKMNPYPYQTKRRQKMCEREMLTWVAEVLQLLLLAKKQIPRDCSLCPENIAATANI